MKRITKLLCLIVAFVMSFSVFAFAACDDETSGTSSSSNNTSSSTNTSSSDSDVTSSTTDSSSSLSSDDGSVSDDDSSSMLSTALLSTVNEIYTSTTGYEFNLDANFSITEETNGTVGAGIDATILTQNDGTNFNVDAEAYLSTTESYEYNGEIETYTDYQYMAALLRGTDLYTVLTETNEEGMTSAEIQELIYEYTDLAELVTSLSDDETIDSYLGIYESGEYDGIITAISNFATNILTDMTGVIDTQVIPTGTSGSLYVAISLTYDIAAVLLEYVTAADDFINVICGATSTEYTVSDLFGDATVQTLLAKYLDGMTGKDIYEILNFVVDIINASNSSTDYTDGTTEATETTSGIPEGTTEQSAYDYIMALVADESIGSFVLNSEELMTYISMASAITGELKSAFESATIAVAFTLNATTYSLSSISFDIHDLTISGYDVDLDFDVTMESKAVTLTDVSQILYNTSISDSGVVTVDETRYAEYDYTLYNYFDGTAELYVSYDLYEYDADYMEYMWTDWDILLYTVEYTLDNDGNITAVTLTDYFDDTAEPVTYTVTDNTITLKFYDEMIEVVIALG